MKRNRNNRGMTLVELLVTLVILVLVITLASSMLLSAYRFFNKSAEMNLNKLSSDGVYQIVSEQLKYATELKVLDAPHQEYETGDWHWITVNDNGHLLMDGKDVFDDTYYHGQRLALEAYADGDARLYLNVTLENTQKEKSYQTASAFETLNIRQAQQFPEFASARKAIAHPKNSGYSEATRIKTPNLVFYYYVLADRVYTGTVLDYLYSRTPENTEEFVSGDDIYTHGTFVWWNGSWWYSAKEDGGIGQGKVLASPDKLRGQWVKVSREWSEDSLYLKGAVIWYKDAYYQCTTQIFLIPPDDQDGDSYWKKVVRDEEKSTNTKVYWKDA